MTFSQSEDVARSRALEVRRELTDWLLGQAVPLWWSLGTDHAQGGFFEKIDRNGRIIDDPRRTRVVGRQIYSFAVAGGIGWQGPADKAVAHGVDYIRRISLSPGGTVVFTTRPDGTVVDDRVDLYDQAFALFGLAAAYRFTGDAALAAIAARLRERLDEGWAHPGGGYEETMPRTLPLKANPHMHLFEASMAWERALAGTVQAAGWATMSDDLAHLCLTRFVDPATGSLREFFDGDWRPMPDESGRIIEPGHQFEWSWLLADWGRRRNRADAIAVAERLLEIGEHYGTDHELGITFNALWDDLSPKDRRFRLWPQTERIKAWVAAAERAPTPGDRAAALEKVAIAARGLQRFLAEDVAGTWHERMTEDGATITDASPASSLYHISCAIEALWSTPVLADGQVAARPETATDA